MLDFLYMSQNYSQEFDQESQHFSQEVSGEQRQEPEGSGELRIPPDTSGSFRREPDTSGHVRKRPVVAVDPTDDSYSYTPQSATVLAANKGLTLSDRRVRAACEKEDPTILKCVWKRVGATKPQWYVGANSLEEYIYRSLQSQSLPGQRTHSAPSGDVRTRPDTSGDQEPSATGARENQEHEAKGEIQALKDELAVTKVELEVKGRLLMEERKARREDMNQVAKLAEQLGRLKEQNTNLQLAAGGSREEEDDQPHTVYESPLDRFGNDVEQNGAEDHPGSEGTN